MYNLQVIFLISILPYVLLQTQDPYLCEGEVQVSYTITERIPMEEYGRFAEHFRRIGIQSSIRSVVGEVYPYQGYRYKEILINYFYR